MSPKAILLIPIFVALLLPAYVFAQSLDYGFVFLDFPAEIEIPAGSSAIAEVAVKNIGRLSNIVELEIETTAPISASIVPGSLAVAEGGTGVFSISFFRPPENVINKYPSKLRLKGKNVDVTKDFILLLTPSPEKKFEISNNYLVLLNRYESLSKKFGQVRDTGCVFVEAGDVTAVTPKQIVDSLQQLRGIVGDTKTAVDKGDFVTASIEEGKGAGLADRIDSEINSLKTSQESCENEKSRVSSYLTGGAIGTTLGIVVIVVILGLATWKHYKNAPRVRRLIRTPGYSISSKPQEQPSGVKRVERDFKYEFRKKK